MMDGSLAGSARDERGRFVPGQSGNPMGKVSGTRNRATLLRAALDSEEGSAMARIVIDKRSMRPSARWRAARSRPTRRCR